MAMVHAPGFLALVNEAKTRVTSCSVEDFLAKLETGEQFVLIDVREDHEWVKGHIPGAHHMGRGILERDMMDNDLDGFVDERALGVDVDNLLISQPDYGEQGLEIADRLILSGALDVVVIDSVAALVPKGELEGEMGDSKMGLQARLMSQALRKLTATISKTNTICIFINQLREKIGVMFGNPETTTGGNALKFYSSVRLDIRRMAQIKDGDMAPDFKLSSSVPGKTFTLSEFKGKKSVVLAFFPLAFTGG